MSSGYPSHAQPQPVYPPEPVHSYPPVLSQPYPAGPIQAYPPEPGHPYPPGPGQAYLPGPGQPYTPAGAGQPFPPSAGQPIAMQPFSGGGAPAAGWGMAPAGAAPVNCPPGLEYLASVDQLLVKQKIEALEAFTGFETNNKYEVLNSMGQRIFVAVEDTCCCTRNCCGSSRPFDIKVMDNHRKEVMHLERPLRCECCICFCCLQKMEVQAPPGSLIGYVRQAWNPCCIPKYKINNANDETVLRIRGPCFRCNICGDIEFEVTLPDESKHVGMISKQWSGLAKEVFTDADNFGVTFPMDMDVKTKATMLGAVFLIDFMYFEDDSQDVKKEVKRLKH